MLSKDAAVKFGSWVVVFGLWLLPATSTAQDESNFAEATPLTTVNSGKRERRPAISPNGLELYFASDRPGGIVNPDDSGQTDIWVARRSSVLDPFGTPEHCPGLEADFPAPINSYSWESGPDVSADGLTLYFDSNPLDQTESHQEIYYVTRFSLQAPWGNPVQLPNPGGMNSNEWAEESPNISSDGLELYFTRQKWRWNQISDYDIWRSTRASIFAPWGEATLLDINSTTYDGSPSLSADDLTLYFTSYRDGGVGSGDIWISQRASKSAPWGPPINPGPPLNTPEFDGWPDISADGSTLYFARGGWFFDADTNLWQTSSFTTQDRVWVKDESGLEWVTSHNWNYGNAPNSNNRNAIFGDAITQDRSVIVNSAVTAKSVQFNNVHTYLLFGSGNVNLEADTGNADLNVAQGSHPFYIPVNLNDSTDADVAGGAVLTFEAPVTLNGNTLTKTGEGTLVVNDDAGVGTVVAAAGTISGVGTVAGILNNFSATLAPGSGPGIFNVDGDYTQGPDGTLSIEIADGGPGQFDELRISGAADFAGDLAVTFINSFNPAEEYDFDILDFASATGSFNPIVPTLDPSLMWDFSNLLTTGVLSIVSTGPDGDFNEDGFWTCTDINLLTAAIVGTSGDLSFDMNGDGVITLADITEPDTGWLAVAGTSPDNVGDTGGNAFLPGDANLDGTVDGQDFIAWNDHKFTPLDEWCGGDFNADGVVDGQDFISWNDHKFTSSNALINGNVSAVPEPSSTMVMLGYVVGLLMWRRKVRE